MAQAIDHIALANRNQETLDYLLDQHERFPEWIACIAFYKALHVVDAMLDVDGVEPPSDHSDRAEKLKRDSRYKFLYEHYRVLWNASCIARYLSDVTGKEYKSFSNYMTPEDVRRKLVLHRLDEVEVAALIRLGPLAPALKRAVPPGPTPATSLKAEAPPAEAPKSA